MFNKFFAKKTPKNENEAVAAAVLELSNTQPGDRHHDTLSGIYAKIFGEAGPQTGLNAFVQTFKQFYQEAHDLQNAEQTGISFNRNRQPLPEDARQTLKETHSFAVVGFINAMFRLMNLEQTDKGRSRNQEKSELQFNAALYLATAAAAHSMA